MEDLAVELNPRPRLCVVQRDVRKRYRHKACGHWLCLLLPLHELLIDPIPKPMVVTDDAPLAVRTRAWNAGPDFQTRGSVT